MNFCFDHEPAASLATIKHNVNQNTNPADASGHSSYFYGMPLRKSGDIATHLSCAEILELQQEYGQLRLAAVTSRDIKKNWPYQHIYVSSAAASKQNPYPVPGGFDTGSMASLCDAISILHIKNTCYGNTPNRLKQPATDNPADQADPRKMSNTTAKNGDGIPPDVQIDQFIPSEMMFSRDIKEMIQWDTYQLERKLVVPVDGWIQKVSFSPLERHALIGSVKEAHCLSCDENGNWRKERVLRVRNILEATFSPSGRYGLVAGKDLCKIWCLAQGPSWIEQAEITYNGRPKDIHFSPTERALAIISRSDQDQTDTFALYLSNSDGRWVHAYSNDGDQNVSCQFSPNGSNILVTSQTSAALLSICDDGSIRTQYSFNSHGKRVHAAFSKAGHHGVMYTKSYDVYEHDQLIIIGHVGNNWKEVGLFNYTGNIWGAEFTESAQHLAIKTYDRKVRIWSVNDKGRYAETKVLPEKPVKSASLHWKFSASEDVLLIYNTENNLVQILNYDGKGTWRKVPTGNYYHHVESCFSAIPEANCMMICSSDNVEVRHDIDNPPPSG